MRKTVQARALEIMEAEGIGYVKAGIRAAKETFGIPPSDRPMNKAEVRDVVVDGSLLPFAVLAEIASDERSSPDTRVSAAEKYLAHINKVSSEESDVSAVIKIVGGLPD